MSAKLGVQQHGKGKVRLGRTWREGNKHYFVEWRVQAMHESDMAHAYYEGSNKDMTTTDTTKNTVCPSLTVTHDPTSCSKRLACAPVYDQTVVRDLRVIFSPVQLLPDDRGDMGLPMLWCQIVPCQLCVLGQCLAWMSHTCLKVLLRDWWALGELDLFAQVTEWLLAALLQASLSNWEKFSICLDEDHLADRFR